MLSFTSKFFLRNIRAFSTVHDVELCTKGFDEIIRSRTSCRQYKQQQVDDSLLDKILSETLLAPTAYNWQPYKIVILKDKANLEKLASFTPKKNANVIRQVPGVAVFLADTEPRLAGEAYKGLWKREGFDESKVGFTLSRFGKLIGKGGMTGLMAKCSLKQESNKSFAQEYYTKREWSIKQTIFPMELFVLSCQAHGLCSLIMEGFDGRHVRELIHCPDRYFVVGLVPFGYSSEENTKPTLRYEAKSMVFNERFGEERTTVREFKRVLCICYTHTKTEGTTFRLHHFHWNKGQERISAREPAHDRIQPQQILSRNSSYSSTRIESSFEIE